MQDEAAGHDGGGLAATPWRVAPWLGVALLLGGLLTMPISWQGAARYDSVHTAALMAALSSALLLAVGQLKSRRTAHVLAAALAVLSVRWAESAVPAGSWTPLDNGLRLPMAGLSCQAFAALACGGWVALGRRDGAVARAVAGLGTLGMALSAWLPVGIAGQLALPWQLALQGELRVATAAAAAVTGQPLVHRGPLLLVALGTAVASLALLWVRRWQRPHAWGTGGLLALPVLWWAAAEGGMWLLLLQVGGLATALALTAATEELDKRQVNGEELVRAVEPLAVALLVAGWLLLKANGLRYSTTDESLYFYAAKLWSEGILPYRDFFFSHPPLHLAVPALLYKLLGYHFLIGKWLSALAALAGGLFTWRIGRHWLGALGGVLALALHLLACETLQASTNLTGINLTTAWLMAGLWAAWVHGRFLLAGALIGAAASTGFYAAGGVLALAVLAALQPWRQAGGRQAGGRQAGGRRVAWHEHAAVRTLLGFVLVWGSIALLCRVVGGEAYTAGVYEYHFAKRAKTEGFTNLSDSPLAILSNFVLMLGSARDWQVTLYYHAPHIWLALLLPLALAAHVHVTALPWRTLADPRQWWQPGPARALLAWSAALALLVEFGSFKERYDFYYALILPLGSVAAAAALVVAGGVALAAVQQRRRARPWAVALMAAMLLWPALNMSANRTAYPTEFGGARAEGKGPGERLEFEWIPPPGPAWVGEWTQALLWKPYRIRGSVEAGQHHYLWSKKRWFSTAEEIAAYVRAHSSDDETLSGASDYAPLVALLAGRRMAGHHVDTNSKVFSTGAVPLERFWDEACRDKLKFLVVAPQSYFSPQDLPKRASVVQNFHRDRVFTDPHLKHWRTQDIELWVRNSDAPCSYKGPRGVAPALMN